MKSLKTVYDVRNLLKRYGIFIYTGNRVGDLELMEIEVRDLYEAKLIDISTFQNAVLLLRNEKTNLI